MVRQMSLALVLAGSACLLTACGDRPEPAKGKPTPAPSPPARADVTLHVPDMTGRQGIT